MTDIVSPLKRSEMMSGIRGRDTRPEMLVRKGLHALGFRYRLHDRKLPGAPDIVLSRYRAIIFIHGCFWHGHQCSLFRWPETRPDFWRAKIEGNRARDETTKSALMARGWRIFVVWECSLRGRLRRSPDAVIEAVADWIRTGGAFDEMTGGSHEH